MEIRAIHHICIQTATYPESLRFYTEVLGFELVKQTQGFHGRLDSCWLRGGGIMIELQTAKEGTALHPWSSLNAGPVHFALLVKDVQLAYEELNRRGDLRFKVKNGQELYKVEGSYLFKLRAPEGTEIEVRDSADISTPATGDGGG